MKLYWDPQEQFQTECTLQSIECRNNVQDQLPGYPGLFLVVIVRFAVLVIFERGLSADGESKLWHCAPSSQQGVITRAKPKITFVDSFFFSWLSYKTAPFRTLYLYLSLSVTLFFLALARRQLCAVLIDGVTQALQQNIFELLIKRRQAGNAGEWEDWLLLRTPSHLRSAPLSPSTCVYLCVHAGVPYATLMRKAGGWGRGGGCQFIFND